MAFFDKTRPGKLVQHGDASFELPILYFHDDAFGLIFTASLSRVHTYMPSAKLHPVRLARGRALVGVNAFHYIDSSIGPYGEVAVVVPVTYGRRPAVPVLPALLEGHHRRFGYLVLHLPVTTREAYDAGRGEWGYAKFVADMHFTKTPEYLECKMSEEQEHILTLRVARRGKLQRDNRPLVTYTVRDGDLIRTRIKQGGIRRESRFPRGYKLELGDHPVARTLKELELSRRPILSRYWVERSAVLPKGKVIDRGVASLEGYHGKNRHGELRVEYLEPRR